MTAFLDRGTGPGGWVSHSPEGGKSREDGLFLKGGRNFCDSGLIQLWSGEFPKL